MGAGETVKEIRSHELGIMDEALAETQEIANAVLAFARVSLLHTDFPGRSAARATWRSRSRLRTSSCGRCTGSASCTPWSSTTRSAVPDRIRGPCDAAHLRDRPVCKSKNAGPFELTIDVVFGSREMYDRVKATGILNAALDRAPLRHIGEPGAVHALSGRRCVQGHDPAAHTVGRRRRYRYVRRPAARAAAQMSIFRFLRRDLDGVTAVMSAADTSLCFLDNRGCRAPASRGARSRRSSSSRSFLARIEAVDGALATYITV